MVRNRNEDTADSAAKNESGNNTGNREQQPRSRSGSRGRYRSRQQNTTRNEERSKDAKGTSASNHGHSLGTQKNSRNYDGFNRDNARQRGYRRDKGKGADRDNQKHSAQSHGRYGHSRKSREDETIEDIKRDILRIEKEIELEIREIRSMKFL